MAKIAEKPLYRLLADRYRGGVADDKVWVCAAGGYYYPGKDDAQLQAEMRSYRDRGYKVVKMKIGGASLDVDLAPHRVGAGDRRRRQNLAVDANGRFDLETGIAYAEALKPYNLFWYEEVGDPLDYALQAELSKHYDLPMATGENLFSHQDARNLLRHGGMRPDRDTLQFDCALSYGLVEYLRTLDVSSTRTAGRRAGSCRTGAPDVVEHRRRPAPGRQRVLSRRLQAVRRLRRRHRGGERSMSDCPTSGRRLRG